MTKLDIKQGDKIHCITSKKTYEKVEDIRIENGNTKIITKEFYQNTDSLVSDETIKLTFAHLKSRVNASDDIYIE